MKLYLLQHIRPLENGDDDVKLIGIYSSLEEAQQAICRAISKPGFAATPDGFHIDEYPLNKDHWAEGYI